MLYIGPRPAPTPMRRTAPDGPPAVASAPSSDAEILAQYDAERRRPPPHPGVRVERVGPIVRVVGSFNCIVSSDLDETTAPAAVAEQAAHFRAEGAEVEWKLCGHDRPSNLADLLAAAGFAPEEPETLVVYDLAEPLVPGPLPAGLRLERIEGPESLRRAVSVSEAAFEGSGGWSLPDIAPLVRSPEFVGLLAWVGDVPVSAARLELPRGSAFASLWGGGVVRAYRGRGIYRALVAARAEIARARGYRFLTVDARESSRPILERLGFRPLTSLQGWVLRPGGPAGPSA
jgi:ribosomal protein S18 acetylase RimI-like enzyme